MFLCIHRFCSSVVLLILVFVDMINGILRNLLSTARIFLKLKLYDFVYEIFSFWAVNVVE